MDYKPVLSWDLSATGHFSNEQLTQLSAINVDTLISILLGNNDGPAVIYTIVELLRHGEGGIALSLHANNPLMNLWRIDSVSADDYGYLLEIESFFQDHEHEISFREKRRY